MIAQGCDDLRDRRDDFDECQRIHRARITYTAAVLLVHIIELNIATDAGGNACGVLRQFGPDLDRRNVRDIRHGPCSTNNRNDRRSEINERMSS